MKSPYNVIHKIKIKNYTFHGIVGGIAYAGMQVSRYDNNDNDSILIRVEDNFSSLDTDPNYQIVEFANFASYFDWISRVTGDHYWYPHDNAKMVIKLLDYLKSIKDNKL